MTKTVHAFCVCVFLTLPPAMFAAGPVPARIAATRGFEVNRGQASDPGARYFVRLRGHAVAIDGEGASFSWDERGKARRIRLQLVKSKAGSAVSGERPLSGIVSYFSGNDPAKWRTGIPTFGRVRVREAYPGIDVLYYRNSETDLEHDFVVAPGADPTDIAMKITGAGSVRLDRGDVLIQSGASEFRLKQPVAYQTIGNERHEVSVSYELRRNQVRFRLGTYDRGRELVIDPAAVFASYVGGSGYDHVNAVALDASGNTYVAGSNGYAFVNKYDASGQLVYSAQLGLTLNEFLGAHAIAVDGTGRAIVGGGTYSIDFPVVNGYSNKCGVDVGGAFVSVINAAGTALEFSTCISGSGWPNSFPTIPPASNIVGIAVDGAGLIYAGGSTQHTNFLTTNGHLCNTQPCATEAAGSFVAKFDPTKTGTESLVYSTIIDGASIAGIAIQKGCASNCSVYFAGGGNASQNFPITAGTIGVNPVPGANSGASLSKLNATGTGLEYSTLLASVSALGTYASGTVYGLTVDADGNTYTAGHLPFNGSTQDHPAVNALTGSCYAGPMISKVNATASAYGYQACFSGGVILSSNGIGLDDAGNLYVAGVVYDTSLDALAPADALQPVRVASTGSGNTDGFDGFLAKINAAATQVLYATFFSGSLYEYVNDLALNGSRVAIAGNTTSRSGLPLVNPYQSQPGNPVFNSGNQDDGFVAMFDLSATPAAGAQLSPTSLDFGDRNVNVGGPALTVTLTARGNRPLAISGITVDGDYSQTNDCPATLAVNTSCTISVLVSPTAAGTRTGTLSVSSNAAGSPHTVALSTNAIGVPQFSVTNNLAFPQTVLGASSGPQTLVLNSIGTAPLVVSSVASLTPDYLLTHNCTSPVPANSSCTVSVTFIPTTIGTLQGSIQISSNVANSPNTFIATGVGAAPVPTLTAVTPNTGTVGRQSMTVTLSGTNFIPQSTATVASQPRTVTYVNSTTLKVALIAADLSALGTKAIVVTNPTPGGGTSNSVTFTIATNSPPEGEFELAENEAQAGSANVPQLGRLKFSGWAADPDDGAPAARVQVIVTPPDTVPTNGVFVFSNGRIRRLSPGGILSTYAGTGTAGHSGDNGLATAATIFPTNAPSFDASGNLYVPENSFPNFYIRRVDAATGVITTWAGNGTISAGVNVVATSTGVPPDSNVVFDSAGNAYVSIGTQIRKIAVNTKVVTNYAGTGAQGITGDGGLATSATFCRVNALAIDAANNLYTSDSCNHNIRRINATTKIITLVAGASPAGFSGDGGLATGAQMNTPGAIAVNGAGDLFIADRANGRVRKVDGATQKISTIMGGTGCTSSTGPGPSTTICVSPVGVAVDANGNLYVNSSTGGVSYILRMDTTGYVTLFAGSASGSALEDGHGLDAKFDSAGLAVRGTTLPFWIRNATLGAVRSDIATANGRSDYANSGWSVTDYAAPLSTGDHNVRVFAYDVSNARSRLAADKTITITAQAGALASLTGGPLDFGTVNPKSTTVVKTAQLTNLGNTALAISSIVAPSGWTQTNTCSSSLGAGLTCTITISFAPTNFGANVGTLQVNSSAVNGQVTLSLSGKLDLSVTVFRLARRARGEANPAPVNARARLPEDVKPNVNVLYSVFVAFPIQVEPPDEERPAEAKVRGKKSKSEEERPNREER